MHIMDFLLTRIAEDEADLDATPPSCRHEDDFRFGGTDDYQQFTIGYGRASAECASKRAILAAHRPSLDPYGDPEGATCTMCADSGPNAQGFPCSTVRALAAVYADHPDYRPEWAPNAG